MVAYMVHNFSHRITMYTALLKSINKGEVNENTEWRDCGWYTNAKDNVKIYCPL